MPQSNNIADPLITAGATVVGAGINAYNQNQINQDTLNYNREMYERQLADNRFNWSMQNAYNSPTAQMDRLKSAGLNPNLVYGNGATATGGTIANTSPGSWNPRAPEFGAMITNAIGAYQDVRLKQAQYDNLKATNTAILQKSALDTAKTAGELARTARSNFDLQLAKDLRDSAVNSAHVRMAILHHEEFQQANRLGVGSLYGADYDNAYNRSIQGQLDLAKLAEARERIKNTSAGTRLRELEASLNENGIQKGDPVYLRIISQFLNPYIDKFRDSIKR